MPWDEARINLLRTMYLAEGKSCSEIAIYFGDVSREAVCGKLYRLQIKRGRTSWQRSNHEVEKGGAFNFRPPKPAKVAVAPRLCLSNDDQHQLFENTIPFLETGERHCRWLLGKKEGEWHVCGQPKAHGAFCAGHAARAYKSLLRPK